MHDPTNVGDGPRPPTYTVVSSGKYGTVLWNPDKDLWDVLPHREKACDAAAGVIDPFFVGLVDDLLARLDINATTASLPAAESSLHTVEHDCDCYGACIWQVSEGVWELIPADRRDNLIELMKAAIHTFLRERVRLPLATYAVKGLRPS